MSFHEWRLPAVCGLRRAFPPIALAILAGFAVGCSEGPTTAALDAPEPRFHHNGGHGGGPPGGGGDDGGGTPALQFDLVDPAGTAGVYSDSGGPYPSSMLDEAGGLHPPCGERTIDLRGVMTPNQSIIDQETINLLLGEQSTCNGDTGGSNDGRVFLKAPDLLTLTADCDSDGDPGTGSVDDCRTDFGGTFDTYPSYEWKGNRIKATGMFSEAARHFEENGTGPQLTWVFQDPKVTIVARDTSNAPTTWRFEATEVHLYGLGELCVATVDTNNDGDFLDGVDADANQDGIPENCLPFDLSVDFTLEPEGS